MKLLIVIPLLILSSICHASEPQPLPPKCNPTDTTLLTQILALPLQNYIGKPVDSLFAVLPSGFTDRQFMPIKIGYVRGITQMYFTSQFNNCYVQIFIDTFQHLPIPNRTSVDTWNMELGKKETIAFIKVYKNDYTCVYGCNNENYYYP